jgi:preprotein translocase subunit SecD
MSVAAGPHRSHLSLGGITPISQSNPKQHMKRTIQLVSVCMMAVTGGCRNSAAPPVFEMRLTAAAAAADTEDMNLTNEVTKATEVLHVQKTPVVDQGAVRSASVQKVSGAQYPFVEIALTDKGRDRLAEATRQNIGKHLVITTDGRLLSAPIIMAEIKDGRAWISGSFTEQEATKLAVRINSVLKK